MQWIQIAFRFSLRPSTRQLLVATRSVLLFACVLVLFSLCSSSLAADTNSVDRGVAYTNAVEQLALKLASGDPVRAVDYQQQIYNLLANFFSYYENDGVWYTLPMDESIGVPLSDFLGRGLFTGYSTGDSPSGGDSYLRAISRAINGTPQGTYANASGGILPLVSGIATNTWRRADIERALLLLAASSNTWDRSSVVDVVDNITSINSGIGMMQLDVYDIKSDAYDLLQSLWSVQADLESTIDSDGRQRVSFDDLVFDPIVEVIEEQTSTYIQSLDSLVRDFVIGGVDYTASNTAAISEYVENINDILSENFDVQLSLTVDSISNIAENIASIRYDALGYSDDDNRDVKRDFRFLQQQIGVENPSATNSIAGLLRSLLFSAEDESLLSDATNEFNTVVSNARHESEATIDDADQNIRDVVSTNNLDWTANEYSSTSPYSEIADLGTGAGNQFRNALPDVPDATDTTIVLYRDPFFIYKSGGNSRSGLSSSVVRLDISYPLRDHDAVSGGLSTANGIMEVVWDLIGFALMIWMYKRFYDDVMSGNFEKGVG